MAFKEFIGRYVSSCASDTLVRKRGGCLVFSVGAVRFTGFSAKQRVTLWWDADTGSIGIHPAAVSVPGAFSLNGTGTRVGGAYPSLQVRCPKFFTECGMVDDDEREFRLTRHDGEVPLYRLTFVRDLAPSSRRGEKRTRRRGEALAATEGAG